MLKSTQPMFLYDTPFLGRENEIKRIDAAINAWEKSMVIGIDGDGGIGKTRLLVETYRRYVLGESTRLKVLEMIDFDDVSFHIPGRVEQHIAETLGKNKFESYWAKLVDLRRIEKANVSQDTLVNQKALTLQAFIEDLNNFMLEKRVILLFDTAEKQLSDETWGNIIKVITDTKNLCVLIAGRDAKPVWERFKAHLADRLHIEYLKPLDTQASKQYLAEKQKKLHMNIAPDIAQGLLLLAQGHPIFLDLAVEWVSRDLPKDWISQISKNKLSTGDLRALKKEFEQLLVGRIVEIRTPMDRLCLMLSRIYPLDVAGIADLLKMEPEKAQELFEDARTYVFIKRIPGKRISLHDEMRRMINEHVWPEIDKTNERRIYESKLIIEHVKRKIADGKQKLARLEDIPESSSFEPDHAPVGGNLLEVSALEREIWISQQQYLEHLLFVAPTEALQEFCRMFDDDQRNNPREILVNAMLSNPEKLQQTTLYDFAERQIKILYEKGEFEQVLSIGKDIEQEQLPPEHRLEFLNRLANARMALGKIPEALSDLNKALTVCQNYPEALPWIDRVYSLIGLAYRQMGQYNEAIKYYDLALETAAQETQTASILNNLGYVLALEGRYSSAITYCQKGLEIHKKNKMKVETGASLSAMGEIYRNWNRYEEALDCYNQSLAIFEPENSVRWLARLYSFRGAVYRLQDEYSLAEADLKKSVAMNVPAEQPWAYHVLGCVYSDRSDLEQAMAYFGISDQLALDTHDTRSHVNNLVSAAEIYYEQWSKSKAPEILEKITKANAELNTLLGQNFDFPHHLGRMQRIMGDIAFEQKDYTRAMHLYAEAYASLGKRTGGYGKNTFLDEIKSISLKIEQLTKENAGEAYKWCKYFMEYWSDEARIIMRRDDLVTMCKIHKIELALQSRQ